MASTLGDGTMLGYLKGFMPDILVGYTSGTGISGLFSTVVVIVFSLFITTTYQIFMACILLPVIYYI